MRKLLLLAIPLLLFGFTIPRDTFKKEKPNKEKTMVANTLCVASCTATHIRVKIAGDPIGTGILYWYVDGIYTGTTGRIYNVPKTATNVYVTLGATLPGTLLAGDSVAALNTQCSAPPCP